MYPDIADLDLDVDISVASPEDYADSTPPPIAQGSYTFRVLAFGLDKDRTTKKVRKTRTGLPTLVLESIEVAEGPLTGRKVGWQRYSFKPFEREASGRKEKVSQVADLIRGIDRTVDLSHGSASDIVSTTLDVLQRAKDQGLTFRARAHWEGFDRDYFESQCLTQGINPKDYVSADAKKLRKEATLSGVKGFPKGPVGIGPSGKPVEARVLVSNIYPQKEEAEQASA